MKRLHRVEPFAGYTLACLILLSGMTSGAQAQAIPLPTVSDSNYEVFEFFNISPVSSPNFSGGTLVAAVPGGGGAGGARHGEGGEE